MVEFSDFLHTFFKANNKAATGIIMMGTIHWSKGLEADDVYIVQPATLPLPERIALGGWQKYEELCIQARTPYFYLPNTRPYTLQSVAYTRATDAGDDGGRVRGRRGGPVPRRGGRLRRARPPRPAGRARITREQHPCPRPAQAGSRTFQPLPRGAG